MLLIMCYTFVRFFIFIFVVVLWFFLSFFVVFCVVFFVYREVLPREKKKKIIGVTLTAHHNMTAGKKRYLHVSQFKKYIPSHDPQILKH